MAFLPNGSILGLPELDQSTGINIGANVPLDPTTAGVQAGLQGFQRPRGIMGALQGLGRGVQKIDPMTWAMISAGIGGARGGSPIGNIMSGVGQGLAGSQQMQSLKEKQMAFKEQREQQKADRQSANEQRTAIQQQALLALKSLDVDQDGRISPAEQERGNLLRVAATTGDPAYIEKAGSILSPQETKPYSPIGKLAADLANGVITQDQFNQAIAEQSGSEFGGGLQGRAIAQYLESLPPEQREQARASITKQLLERPQMQWTPEGFYQIPGLTLGGQEAPSANVEQGVPQETVGVPVNTAGPTLVQESGAEQRAQANFEKEQREARIAKEKGYRAVTQNIDSVIGTLDDAIGLTNDGTTGRSAALLMSMPDFIKADTDTFRLYQKIDTIKANIGFDKLQQMRDASPTGGALGQVAIQELDALQKSIESLNPGIGAPALKENLEKVKTHYENWKRIVEQANQSQDSELNSLLEKYGD